MKYVKNYLNKSTTKYLAIYDRFNSSMLFGVYFKFSSEAFWVFDTCICHLIAPDSLKHKGATNAPYGRSSSDVVLCLFLRKNQ